MSDEGTSLILIAGWARGVQWKVRNIIEKHALQMSHPALSFRKGNTAAQEP
jgi:hypothetical protein